MLLSLVDPFLDCVRLVTPALFLLERIDPCTRTPPLDGFPDVGLMVRLFGADRFPCGLLIVDHGNRPELGVAITLVQHGVGHGLFTGCLSTLQRSERSE